MINEVPNQNFLSLSQQFRSADKVDNSISLSKRLLNCISAFILRFSVAPPRLTFVLHKRVNTAGIVRMSATALIIVNAPILTSARIAAYR